MTINTAIPIHAIPLWFLAISLFLPRVCIVVAWLGHTMPAQIPNPVGLIPAIVALLIPRILILFWIYNDQGIGIWFLLHAIALLIAWGGGSTRVVRRRRRVVEVVD